MIGDRYEPVILSELTPELHLETPTLLLIAVDRSITSGVDCDSADAAVASATITLAHALGPPSSNVRSFT